jgi:hypothetical protein
MSPVEADLKDFYEESYRKVNGEKYGRWRQLGAVTKAITWCTWRRQSDFTPLR